LPASHRSSLCCAIVLLVCSPPLLLSLFLRPFCLPWPAPRRDLHSFPTRRSSDLLGQARPHLTLFVFQQTAGRVRAARVNRIPVLDRKSTRLNSSHGSISYAVFCLKKNNRDKSNREARKQHVTSSARSSRARWSAA